MTSFVVTFSHTAPSCPLILSVCFITKAAVVAVVSYRSLIKITIDFAVRSSSLHFLIFSTVLHQTVKTRKIEGSLAKVHGCYFTFQPYRKVSNIRNIAAEEGAVINVALG
jgi:hypothetical protein